MNNLYNKHALYFIVLLFYLLHIIACKKNKNNNITSLHQLYGTWTVSDVSGFSFLIFPGYDTDIKVYSMVGGNLVQRDSISGTSLIYYVKTENWIFNSDSSIIVKEAGNYKGNDYNYSQVGIWYVINNDAYGSTIQLKNIYPFIINIFYQYTNDANKFNIDKIDGKYIEISTFCSSTYKNQSSNYYKLKLTLTKM